MSRWTRIVTGARAYSLVPFESVPRNKFNAKTSAFNLKPNPTQGLVHNPAASAPSLKKTPRPFLPASDPRLTALADTFKVYTPEELQDMPLIMGYKAEREYTVDKDTALKIVKLRTEDPDTWTIRKLAQEFGVDRRFVNVVTGSNTKRQEKVDATKNAQVAGWTTGKVKTADDRRKRVQMWLRNEY